MSVDRGYILGPVSISDIKTILGISSNDLATICKSSRINKWAVFKPEKIASVAGVSLGQRKANHMGLNTKSVPLLKDSGSGVAKNSLSDVLAQINEWTYTKPIGGSASPYRMSDFLDMRSPSSLGYDHNAKPCDADWKDVNINADNLSATTVLVSNFTFRLNEESASNIGSANSHNMPLSYIQAPQTNWYLAVAVYIPSQGGWLIARGKKSLGEVTTQTIGQVFPNLDTNQWLRHLMKDYATLDYIPCIVQNPSDKIAVINNTNMTYISMSNGDVMCMPSGATNQKIHINTPIKNKTVTDTDPNGQTVSGQLLDGNYTVVLPFGSFKLLYLVSGSTDTNTGITTGGWFLCCPSYTYAAYGFSTNCLIVIYCEINEGKVMKIGESPKSSISISNMNILFTKLSAAVNPTVVKFYDTLTCKCSNTAKVTYTHTDSAGNKTTASFYGYVSDIVNLSLGIALVKK